MQSLPRSPHAEASRAAEPEGQVLIYPSSFLALEEGETISAGQEQQRTAYSRKNASCGAGILSASLLPIRLRTAGAPAAGRPFRPSSLVRPRPREHRTHGSWVPGGSCQPPSLSSAMGTRTPVTSRPGSRSSMQVLPGARGLREAERSSGAPGPGPTGRAPVTASRKTLLNVR